MDVNKLTSACYSLLGDFNFAEDAGRDVLGLARGRATWNSREIIRLTSHFLLEMPGCGCTNPG